MYNPDDLRLVMEQVNRGATDGMVKIKMRERGVPDHQTEEMIEKARMMRSLNTRGRGLLFLLAGSSVIVLIGAYIFWTGHIFFALLIGLFFGVIIAFKGLVELLTGTAGAGD